MFVFIQIALAFSDPASNRRCAIYYAKSSIIADSFVSWRKIVANLDAFIWETRGNLIDVDSIIYALGADEDCIKELLKAFAAKSIITIGRSLKCSIHHEEIEENNDRYYCDSCNRDVTSEEVYYDNNYTANPLAERAVNKTIQHQDAPVDNTDSNRSAKIHPWDGRLAESDYLFETQQFGDEQIKAASARIESIGFCLIRITGQSPGEEVIRSVIRNFGPLSPAQNDHPGDLKMIIPKITGRQNSGDTAKKLGLHMDGTQDKALPVALAFHYVAGPKTGGQSIFVDLARVLADMEANRRHSLLVNLARRDAALFYKPSGQYHGPMVFTRPSGAIGFRIRFDEVLTPSVYCRDEYEYFGKLCSDPKYELSFMPREGDLLIFDNQRLLHSRDEVFGQHVRQHWRAWIQAWKTQFQDDYITGIRPIAPATYVAIAEANRS